MDYPYETGSWNRYEQIVLPITLAIIVLISVALGFLLRKKDYKIKSIPLKIIAGILFVAEIVKQILNIVNGYSLWAIPLHFCSLFVFFFPLSELMPAKICKVFKPVSVACATAMTLLFYFGPNTIISDSCYYIFFTEYNVTNVAEFGRIFSNYHTFFFHHFVILYLGITLALKLYSPKKSDVYMVLAVMSAYIIITMPLAHIIDVNFCNMLESNIPFMEAIRVNLGQFVYSIAMHVAIPGGCTLIIYVYYLVVKLITSIKNKKLANDKERS